MPLRPCLDCGTPSPATRCRTCARAADRARGTTSQRGLAGAHARISKAYREADEPCACTGCTLHEGPCGQHGTPDNPITAGHITPRNAGGTNDPGNYEPQCRRCNSAKGAR